MTIEELRTGLADDESIARQPFIFLKELAQVFNSGDENLCRDLVLHALEHREAFGELDQILEGLVRELGLFPYIDEKSLSLTDSIAYEYHRPLNYDEPIVFHREQALIYRRLLDGDNIILSAPTSFGKSKVIDAIISSGKYENIVVIVPTLALIDETRRRLARFSRHYKIVTQVSQVPEKQNIFIFTAERANVYEQFPHIDFFVIDEFYKIGALTEDRKRTVALNQAFYKLAKGGAQFYLLGPCVKEIPDGFEQRFECRFYRTRFATVASEEKRISVSGDNEMAALCELVESLKGEPTLIFCKSPPRVNEVCNALLMAGVTGESKSLESAAKWMQDNFHNEWILPNAFRRGIGLHHGKLPRSLAQFIVRAFNSDRLNVLACTSTLIEGVNTKAKNVIILDNKIAKEKFDFFTFNNIKGRSGRMFHHFVGRVFLFHDPPTEDLPFVDFPIFTQNSDTPDSMLVHIANEDLSAESKTRLEPFMQQTDLPIELLKKHSNIEPTDLLSLAKRLQMATPKEKTLLSWTSPNGAGLRFVCELAWEHLVKHGHAGVRSGAQLARNVWNLKFTPDIRRRILAELQPSQWAAKTVDDAVERVLEFDRTWASFELPRILRAFSDVRHHVLGGAGDYSYFASQLENLFRKPFQVALEEFGVPLQVSDKIAPVMLGLTSIDAVIEMIRKMPTDQFGLDAFEQELLKDCQTAL